MIDLYNSLLGLRRDFGPYVGYNNGWTMPGGGLFDAVWRTVPMSDEMVDILKSGRARLASWSNIAAGYGFSVHALEAQGYLKYDGLLADLTCYSLTQKGRDFVEARRVADLAAIGVYEVHDA